jgi:uncharacterized protein (DUF2236 family)
LRKQRHINTAFASPEDHHHADVQFFHVQQPCCRFDRLHFFKQQPNLRKLRSLYFTSIGMARNVIILPRPLQRRMEAALRNYTHPGGGRELDFEHPPDEPALTAPDSVSWGVFKNPLALFIGGVTAVLLELAEPRVRTGVWNHTTFRQDPLPRLRRTGVAAMMTVYGPRSRTEAMIAGVATLHGRVSGLTPDGQPYRADDPELLDWVHATASFGFVEAYHAYVRRLSDAERDSFYAEGLPSSRLYGALRAPASRHELDMLFESMRGKLEPSPIVFEFLDIMRRVPLLPRPLAPVQRLLLKAAVEILPRWVRECLGLDERWNLRPWQRHVVRHSGTIADRILLRSAPAVQACRRLGLPDDYLYKSH